MAKVHAEITDELAEWIRQQHVFFIGSAPLTEQGHINISPRGLDSLRVVDAQRVVMLDMTGSGNETAAHLAENGRMTVMFCAFEGAPRILRLYGEGKVVQKTHTNWAGYRKLFTPELIGVRQVFELNVLRVQTSCGFGVPLMDYREDRDMLPEWANKRGEDGIRDYQLEKNSLSIDGLAAPGMKKA